MIKRVGIFVGLLALMVGLRLLQKHYVREKTEWVADALIVDAVKKSSNPQAKYKVFCKQKGKDWRYVKPVLWSNQDYLQRGDSIYVRWNKVNGKYEVAHYDLNLANRIIAERIKNDFKVKRDTVLDTISPFKIRN